MAYVLICDLPKLANNGTVSCDAWSMVDFSSIALKSDLQMTDWVQYLEFDPELFGIVLVSLLLVFVTGHVLGVVVRLMNRS
jgi:hypothetical protein